MKPHPQLTDKKTMTIGNDYYFGTEKQLKAMKVYRDSIKRGIKVIIE